MTVPQYSLPKQTMSGKSVQRPKFVILSKRSAPKDLRTDQLHSMSYVRRSFDSLRSLRMTNGEILRIRPTGFPISDGSAEQP